MRGTVDIAQLVFLRWFTPFTIDKPMKICYNKKLYQYAVLMALMLTVSFYFRLTTPWLPMVEGEIPAQEPVGLNTPLMESNFKLLSF